MLSTPHSRTAFCREFVCLTYSPAQSRINAYTALLTAIALPGTSTALPAAVTALPVNPLTTTNFISRRRCHHDGSPSGGESAFVGTGTLLQARSPHWDLGSRYGFYDSFLIRRHRDLHPLVLQTRGQESRQRAQSALSKEHSQNHRSISMAG